MTARLTIISILTLLICSFLIRGNEHQVQIEHEQKMEQIFHFEDNQSLLKDEPSYCDQGPQKFIYDPPKEEDASTL